VKLYIGTTPAGVEIVAAELVRITDTYRVVKAHGLAMGITASTFELIYRELDRHELLLISQTDAEHQVSAISDGEPESEHFKPPQTRCLDTRQKVVDWNAQHPDDQMRLGDTVRVNP